MKCLYLFLLMAALPFCSGQVSDERVSQDAYPVESAFLKEAWGLFDEGEKCMEQGFALQANYYYGQAVVAVASFRYAVNEILMIHKKEAKAKADSIREEAKKKAEEEAQEEWDDWEFEDEGGLLTALNNLNKKLEPIAEKADSLNRIHDAKEEAKFISESWDLIATQSLVSPYPSFFQAFLLDYQGKDEESVEHYTSAFINPNYPDEPWDFRFLAELSAKDLKALSLRLREVEDTFRQSFQLDAFFYPRDYRNFDAAYLASQAVEILQKDTMKMGDAFGHYEAAVRANPFDPTYFVGCAYLAGRMGNGKLAAYYVNEGLLIAPEHEGLNKLLQAINKGRGSE